MKIRKYKIGTRVLIVLYLLLISTFSAIGIIFNIAAQRYIHTSAISQLNRSYNAMRIAMEQAENILMEFSPELFRYRVETYELRNIFHIETNVMALDTYYNLLTNRFLSEREEQILKAIRAKSPILGTMKNVVINTAYGIFYVSSHYLPIPHFDRDAYWIIYADVTGLSNFARTVNMFLLILVIAMFAVAAIVALLLSNSITFPIQKLCNLALNIGKGDFTPKDYRFRDMEFEELNKALNKSAKQLGAYDTEQKIFFQNVSHELRTPIMSIQCYAEGISCGIMEPKKASATILNETARLYEMIKDILYISKIDNITSAYTASRVNLLDLIRECTLRQKAIAQKKKVGFSFDFDEADIYFDCIGELILRAIENILSNAIRYAKKEIVFSCKKIGDNIELCVKDDGKGIEDKVLPHLFERFFKGKDGNHGIGLALVRAIVEQHNGSVKAENISGSGAAFTIVFPNNVKK